MKIFFTLLSILSIVSAQQCGTCSNLLNQLTATSTICGSGDLYTYEVGDFNLISLGDVSAIGGGDVEGRVLVGGDLSLGPPSMGYSIGAQIVNYPANAPYSQKAFSALVGGDVDWLNGQLNPVNDDATHRQENGVYVGTSDAPSWLRFSQCVGTFDITNLANALTGLSTYYSTAPATGFYTLADNGNTLVLHGNGACDMLLRIPASVWNSVRAFMTMDSYRVDTNIVIDITCDVSPFEFMDAEFPGLASNVIYNFGPSCNGDTIEAKSVTGTILAPFSTLDQANGRILGNVYVGSVENFLQINVIPCPPNPNVCECCGECTSPQCKETSLKSKLLKSKQH